MPSSASESIPYAIEYIRKNRPQLKTVLDVGIGFGKYGFLLREYFDVKEGHKYQPKDWELKITGVEIFENYLSEIQRILYNKIIIGNVLEALPTLGNYDLAILSDVIEHFSKEEGITLLNELFKHCEDIIITTPLGFHEHKSGENRHEEHKSGWIMEDFSNFNIIDSIIISRIRSEDKLLIVYLRK